MSPTRIYFGSFLMVVVIIGLGLYTQQCIYRDLAELTSALKAQGLSDAQINSLKYPILSITSMLRNYSGAVSFGLCMMIMGLAKLLCCKEKR